MAGSSTIVIRPLKPSKRLIKLLLGGRCRDPFVPRQPLGAPIYLLERQVYILFGHNVTHPSFAFLEHSCNRHIPPSPRSSR
jgi:hypothetical protein